MTVIVTDAGFAADDFDGVPTPLTELAANDTPPAALCVSPADDPSILQGRLSGVTLISIEFPSFADGRGFTHAKTLRAMGYTGRLRAAGHVIAEQYAMARRSGFDEVAIDDELATRQPESQWLSRADWQANDYQSRLRAAATA